MTIKCSSIAALRVSGDDLDPEDVSEWLGGTPSSSHQKGDVEVSAAGRRSVRKTGMWCLEASRGPHDSLPDQVSRILFGMPSVLPVSSVVKECHFHHRGHRVHRDQNREAQLTLTLTLSWPGRTRVGGEQGGMNLVDRDEV